MATPVLNLVRPAKGWSAGGSLTQLDGNDFRFREPPTRVSGGPTPELGPSVRVLFDGVPAVAVQVISSAIVRVLTPPHPPDRQIDNKVISKGTVDVVIENLDDDGNPIAGESVTLPGAYTFVRPQLAGKQIDGAWLRIIYAWIEHWRNVCVENFVWNPSVDYDPDTGDVRGYVKMGTLPGIAVTNIAFPDSTIEPEGTPGEIEATEEVTLLRQVPVATDITFQLVLTSNNERELLVLAEVVKGCFRYAPFFMLPVSLDNADAGVAEFVNILTGPITMSDRIGNTNVVTATAPGVILRVMTLDVPGLPTDSLPGVPKWIPSQGTKGIIHHLEKVGLIFAGR